jgi:sugar phosphate isomerase/epimerase
MFDVHNAADESEPVPELIKRFCNYIRHIHVNEENGAEPGRGNYDFESLFAVLEETKYSRWVSVEAFDFSRPPKEIAERALGRLQIALQGK